MAHPTRDINIPTRNFDLPTQVFVPQGSSGQAPGNYPTIVMLHDIFGADAHIQAGAQRLRDLGFLVALPNLFARGEQFKADEDETVLADAALAIPDSQAINDVVAVLNWLSDQPEADMQRVGLAGWGWGGAYALMGAAHYNRPATVADVGGQLSYTSFSALRPGSPLSFVSDLQGPLFGAFAGGDPQFPTIEVERLIARARENDIVSEIKIYQGAPARFWRVEAAGHSVRLWRRLETFFRVHLQQGGAEDNEQDPHGTN